MADYNEIRSLFSTDKEYSNYSKKELYRYDVENPNYTILNDTIKPLNIFFKTARDKFLNYHEGYLVIKVRISYNGAAAPPANSWGIKNSLSIIDSARLLMNDVEVDAVNYNYVIMDILNGIEYSHDYSKIAEKNGYVLNDLGTAGAGDIDANPADTIRSRLYDLTLVGWAAGNPVTPGVANLDIRVPFSDLSTFLRAVDFPIIGNSIKLEVSLRPENIIYVEAAGNPDNFSVSVTSVAAYIPHVTLPTEYYSKAQSGIVKTVNWNKIIVSEDNTQIPRNTLFSKMVSPNVVNAMKLIVFYSKEAAAIWGKKSSRTSTCDINLSFCNLEVDNVKIFRDGLRTPYEFYDQICNLFNMGGTNKNTGALLSYSNFVKVNRWYCFDLKRQEIFETKGRVNQQVKLDVTVDAANADGEPKRALYFLFVEKSATINMLDSTQTIIV